MAYLLYGANGSGSSIVEAALVEIGAEYRVEVLDARNGAHREAPYAAVNPHRKMPTLVTPEGETLTESAAIVLTLDERHRDAELLPPAGTPERAQALRWMIFVVAELYPLVEIMDHPERFSPDDAATAGVKARAHEHWRERWVRVEEALEPGPYLLGDRFCAADLFLGSISLWDIPPEWREAKLPQLTRLTAAVAARPGMAELWRRHFRYG